MKKSLIATLIAGLTFSGTLLAAEAGNAYVKLEGTHYNYTNGSNDTDGFNLQVGKNIGYGITLDAKQEWRHEEDSGKTSNRFEGGASYDYKINKQLTVGVRGALGEKYADETNFGYYAIEPTVSYAINDALKLKASYRYRDSFNDAHADRTNTYKVGADYDLNKTYFVTGSLGRTTGDSEYTSIQGGVGVRF
jgi:hypothetical protein